MKKLQPTHPRILAIAPGTRGFGYAVFEGPDTLVDWGVKTVKGAKNARSLIKAKDLIDHYKPGLVVMEDHSAKGARRSGRIQRLSRQIITMASNHQVKVTLFSREQVRRHFFTDGPGTKDALAEMIGKRFPEELGHRIPPKRKAWMSQDYGMDIFDAVALVLMPGLRKPKRQSAR